jgi:hypothetical protein
MNENDINTFPITLQLDVNKINVILRSLGKHPFDEIAGLIELIKNQGEEQIVAYQQQRAEQVAVNEQEVE